VRYFGWLSPGNRHLLQRARHLLKAATGNLKSEALKLIDPRAALRCPHCGGPLTLLSPLAPRGRAP
jgi:hypothetical protein